MKIIKVIFSILLTIFLGISISVLSGLIMVRNIVNKENIKKIISTKEVSYIVSTNEVAYNTQDIENIEYDELESISQDSNKIHELLDQVFIDQGLPTELIDYILADSEYEVLLSDYLSDFLSYTTGTGEKPILDETKINSILDKNIEKYEQDHNKKVNKEKITTLVSEITTTINEQVENITSNNNLKPILNIIFSKTLLIGLIVNCLIVLILIIIINMKLSSILIYSSLAVLIHSFIFTLLSGVLNLFKNDEILNSNMIKNAYTLISEQIATNILISFVIGFILMIIGIVLKNVKKEKPTI